MSFLRLPPKFQFAKLSLDFVTKYAYFLHEIIFNNFLKKVFSSFVCLFNYGRCSKWPPSVCTQALRHWHRPTPLIQSRGFDAWSFTFVSKNHRRLLSRCSVGTTSTTCYLK